MQSFLLRYGCAVVSVALATCVRILLEPVLANESPFPPLIFAVLFTAWYGGVRPGLVAVVLGAVFADYFLMSPRDSFAMRGVAEYVRLTVYVLVGVGTTIIGGIMHLAPGDTIRKLRQAQDALARAEERLRLTLHASGVGVWSYQIAPNFIEADKKCSILFGLGANPFPRKLEMFTALVHPEDRERVVQEITTSVEDGVEYDTEFRITWPDNTVHTLQLRGKCFYTAAGHPDRMTGVCWDVTERRQAEKALRDIEDRLSQELQKAKEHAEENRRLNDLVEILQSCQTVDEAYRILENMVPSLLACKAGALCLTNPSRNEVEVAAIWGNQPATAQSFRPDECWALRLGKIHRVKDVSSAVRCAHVSNSLANGYICMPLAAQGETLGVLYIETQAAAPSLSSEKATALIETLGGQIAAVGERISPVVVNLRLRELLRNQSIRDVLTGLFNRRYLEESLERELNLANRKKYSVAVVMFDLDRFKTFNDTFGHEAGDLVLREVASVLRLKVRSTDIACRYGGEEFVLTLPEIGLRSAFERTESIRSGIASLALKYRGDALGSITISAGVAMFPANGTTPEQVLKAADQALYRAKQKGGDVVVAAAPSQDSLLHNGQPDVTAQAGNC